MRRGSEVEQVEGASQLYPQSGELSTLLNDDLRLLVLRSPNVWTQWLLDVHSSVSLRR